MELEGRKQTLGCCLLFFFTLFSLVALILCAGVVDDIVIEEVHVGVILDMGSRQGKIVQSCISTALSDFYQHHNNYNTRVILHTRDSKGKPLHVLSAALNLLDNIKVEAIIGAETREEANLLAELGEEARVPIMSLAGLPSPPPHKYPFFVEVTADETSQVPGIIALIEMFKWRDVIFLYESTNYGRDIIPFFIKSFQESNPNIFYRSCIIAASSTNEQIVEELRNLMKLKTTVFVVHMSHVLVPRLFLNAKRLGLMREEYAWILTSTSINFLHSYMDSSVIESMQGVIGLKSYIPASPRLNNLTSRLRRKFDMDSNFFEVRELSPDGIWAYDATLGLAEAIERTWSTCTRSNHQMECSSSEHGPILLREILQKRFKGLIGEDPNGNKLFPSSFEIVNVIGKGERRVGFWACEENKNYIANRRNLLSSNHLETIIWPGGSSTIPKGLKLQLSTSAEKTLRVGVPYRTGFEELVHLDPAMQIPNTTHFSGFCIDVFEAAIRALPYEVKYEFIPFEMSIHQSYNDLIYQVFLQKFDAVAGDTTITANRSRYVDFTIPYTDLGVGMLVPNAKDESMWIFLEPLSAGLWITIAGFFVLTGLVVWIIERPVNREFQGTPSQQIGTIFAFSFSTVVYAHHGEKLLSNLAKFVVIIWLFVVFILTSSYTATLASMMTLKEIQLNLRGNYVGYQAGSIIAARVVENLNFRGFKQYNSVEEYADALSRGSRNGGVSAIVDEVPYINIFLAKHPSGYSMINRESTTNGFGFVFPKGSKLVHHVSAQIEKMREEGRLTEMENTWFHNKTDFMFDDKVNDPSRSLNLHSFRGLFLVTGVSSGFALFLFSVFSLKEKWHLVGEKLQRARRFIIIVLAAGFRPIFEMMKKIASACTLKILNSV